VFVNKLSTRCDCGGANSDSHDGDDADGATRQASDQLTRSHLLRAIPSMVTRALDNVAHTQGKRIREKVRVEPAILAYDQDTGINARLRYSIILGNEGGFFEMNAQTGELFLIREIDLEKLTTPTLSLQIQASQVDNPLRQAHAKVDILVQDINDNSPEVSLSLCARLGGAKWRRPSGRAVCARVQLLWIGEKASVCCRHESDSRRRLDTAGTSS
jgi:hypothetical protein